ncbi:hypothetical protein GCM10023097_77840 [Streptomyces collinus]
MGPPTRSLAFCARRGETDPARCTCVVVMPAPPVANRRLPAGAHPPPPPVRDHLMGVSAALAKALRIDGCWA